ncbi:hypothetical protein K0T92_07125 [Paenibacillus oenotherae]|uniref:Uncharacterized protein n=1 Tax=Paenibacillus oenotherae TaxID=1435645 RepID=A0ABS7D3P0_9BACL|nr:hypothetical protein [Paenibacillus oenotherae]MBW7474513.1 hypothetical protein [Paenibacillus oenotherae]
MRRKSGIRRTRSKSSSRLRKSAYVLPASRLRRAYDEGRLAAESSQVRTELGSGSTPADIKRAQLLLHESWTRSSNYRAGMGLAESMLREGQSFSAGFMDALQLPKQDWLPLPLLKRAAAVVLSCGGVNASACLQQLARLPLHEIIVVMDGGDLGSFGASRCHPGVTIIHIGQMIGGDLARSIGARLCGMDIILFADGGKGDRAEGLAQLLTAIDGGADIALNDETERLGAFRKWDNLSRVKAFMNWSLGRPDLHANSVVSLPHAWSRESLLAVGTGAIAVPALAQQAAIGGKLRFAQCPCGLGAPREDGAALAFGDHFEALQAAMKQQGNRLALPDRVRRRGVSGGGWQ